MIETLNLDCLFHIFDYLTLQQVMQLEHVSEYLREAASKYYCFVHKIEFLLRHMAGDEVEPALVRLGPYLHKLRFSGGYMMDKELAHSIILSVSQNCCNLRSLTLNHMPSNMNLSPLIEIFENLTELNLGNIDIPDWQFPKKAPHLKTLIVNGNLFWTGEFLVNWNTIEKLNVSFCLKLVPANLFAFLEKCSKLRHLDVSQCAQLEEVEFFEKLARFQSNIEELIMKNFYIKKTEELLGKFPKLEIFDVGRLI